MEYPMNRMGPNNYYNDYNRGYNQEIQIHRSDEVNTFGCSMLLFVLFVFCLHFCSYSQRNQEIMQVPLLDKPQLEKVIISNQIIDDVCVICLESYEKKDEISQLKCEHIFHHKCIDTWVITNRTCPLCRIPLS